MARKTEDLTIEVLKQIRDGVGELRGEMHAVRAEVAATNARLDATNARLETSLDRIDARATQVELRLATEIVAVAHAVNQLRVALKDRFDDHERVEDHERRIAQLERKSA